MRSVSTHRSRSGGVAAAMPDADRTEVWLTPPAKHSGAAAG